MKRFFVAAAAAFTFVGGAASADSIDPTSFEATLGVGDSVVVRKTVVVTEAPPTDATIDAFFVIDTTGSMGGAIADAKAATADIISGLAGFGDAYAGIGVFGDDTSVGPGDGTTIGTAFNLDLTDTGTAAGAAAITAAIDDVTLGVPDGGGDAPEASNKAAFIAATEASWRPGSSRFIFVLGDNDSKDRVSDADVIAALAAEDITLIGLDFGFGTAFDDGITDIGGTVIAGGTTPADIVAAITAGIIGGFAEYDEVTVGDLGAGLPEIGVSTECVSADIGACVGADAVGDYDRSVDRTFEFDVTFTRLAPGDKDFLTFALVDGRIVARESDRFPDVVPLPAAGWMLLAGLGGLAAMRRRKS